MMHELKDLPEELNYFLVAIPVRKDMEYTEQVVEPIAKLAHDAAVKAIRDRIEVAA